MYKVGDLLVYKKDVCEIIEIKEKYLRDMDYYILAPIIDKSLKLQIPTSSSAIRDLLTKEEVERLIKQIPTIETIKIESKNIENELTIVVFMDKDINQDELNKTKEDLNKIDNVKSVTLKTKEDIKNSMASENDTFNKIISTWKDGENPLQDSFIIDIINVAGTSAAGDK